MMLQQRMGQPQWQTYRTQRPEHDTVLELFDILYERTAAFTKQHFMNPPDMYAIADIIYTQKPDLIIETGEACLQGPQGTANGGSSLTWAGIMELADCPDTSRVFTCWRLAESSLISQAPTEFAGVLHCCDWWSACSESRGPTSFPCVPFSLGPLNTWPVHVCVAQLMSSRQFHCSQDCLLFPGLLAGWGGRARQDPMEHKLWKKRVTFIQGMSTAPEVVAQMRRAAAAATRVLVLLDSDHSSKNVQARLTSEKEKDEEGHRGRWGEGGVLAQTLSVAQVAASCVLANPWQHMVACCLSVHWPQEELDAFCLLVTPGSYCVVQDTKMSRWGNDGPLPAVKRFLCGTGSGHFI
ncbi:uncharacterized protein HaLaN_12606, partial [Haematococcus lacustris]